MEGRFAGRGGRGTRYVWIAKAVPELEELEVDRERGLLKRTGAALRLNPLDGRALAGALALRRPGDTLTALTMGPPEAEPALREGLAAGADAAVQVSDPALRGSDAWVTARVLATAVRRLDAEVVVAGAFSTDADTGQLPPELAGLLGWPVLTHVRSAERSVDGTGFEIVRDRPDGWSRHRLAAPCVLAMGERISRPPHPSDAEREAAQRRPIPRWTAADLGFAPAEVGLAGSPTRVVELRSVAPPRHPVLFQEGPVEDRVRAAWRTLLALPGPPGRLRPGPSAASRARSSTSLWVLATNEEHELDPAALALLEELRAELPGSRRTALLFGRGPSARETEALGSAGAEALVHLVSPTEDPDSEGVAEGLRRYRRTGPASAGLFVSDPFGREVAGRLAALEGLGLVGDATSFPVEPDGRLGFAKPSFGGGFEARVEVRGEATLATVRPAFRSTPGPHEPSLPPTVQRFELPALPRRVTRQAQGRETDPRYGELDGAELVVTVGLGLGGPEALPALLDRLPRWGAALGATRRVVDAGWLPGHRQVGLTGRALAPRFAVLLGVGKGQNHVVGLRRAGGILAVNPDPQAPVFRYVDAGVVAGWEEALPVLDELLTARARGASPSRPA